MPSQNIKLIKTVNKFIINFLTSQNINQEHLDEWNGKVVQARFKNMIKTERLPKPKGIMSNYLFFCNEEREIVRLENPGLPIKNITCELGKRWAELLKSNTPESIVKLARYTELFEQDKIRYNQEKLLLEPVKIKTKKESSNNMNEYQKFCAEERLKNKCIPLIEVNTLWKNKKEELLKNKTSVLETPNDVIETPNDIIDTSVDVTDDDVNNFIS